MANFTKTRDLEKTNGKSDCDIAEDFYNDFNVASKFGSVISNHNFMLWICSQNFKGMTNGYTEKKGYYSMES